MKRRVLLAGAVAALAMSAVFLIARATAGVPTPSEQFADTIAPLIPVHLFGLLLSLLGGYTSVKIIGFTSTVLAQIVVGALAALALLRRTRANATFVAIVVGLFAVTVAAFWPVLTTQYRGVPAGSARPQNILLYALAYAVFAVVALAVVRAGAANPASGGARTRGAFLEGGIAAVAAIAGGAAWASVFARASFPYDGKQVMGSGVTAITPAEQFYCVTKNVTDPAIDPALWRLRLDGAVPRPDVLDLAALARRGGIRQETTLMCINNEPGGGLMSNAIWTGVPLRDLIGDARSLAGVRRIALHAADNYTDTIPLEKALEPTTLVAWEMNGDGLLPKHGAPVRVVVPGLFGEKNVKWLTRIEAVREDVKGFYERQGWGPSFLIPTHSRIDEPADGAQVASGRWVEMHGVAFAGDRGVARVEVTTDDGRTWHDARFTTPFRQLAWRLWAFAFRPPGPGAYVLSVRATDAAGRLQSAMMRSAETEGATGLHRITVHVA